MVSFADVQSIFRNEKNLPSLQPIPNDFYAKASALTTSLEGEHKKHLVKLLEEIIIRRRNKIVLHTLRLSEDVHPPVNITPLEEPFFREVAMLVVGHKKTLMRTESPQEEQRSEPPKQETTSVRIVKAIPEIVGADSKPYGPFKEDDVVQLPRENADILIKHGFAERSA